MPSAGKKLTRSAAQVRAGLVDPGPLREPEPERLVPRALGSQAAPRLIDPGPPAEWRYAGLTVLIGPERAELRYAREPVGSARPTPEAITQAVLRARHRLSARSRAPDDLLPALADAYAMIVGQRGARHGDRVPLVDVREQLASGTRAQFAWDVARLRRERRLVIDGRRLDLGVATGHETAHRSRVVWIEDGGASGRGSYFASFRLIAQEARS